MQTDKMRTCLLVFIVVPVLFLLGLALVGILFESAASRADLQKYPPPGSLVDIGDYRLHLHSMGEDQGRPTILLEHAAISFSAQWGWIQPELARYTRVVAYDRPGMGWSEMSPERLGAQQFVQQLYAALADQGIEGPYLLVGHSMGGLINRVFAATYPDEVVGMVQVDPRGLQWFGPEAGEMNSAAALVSLASRLGIVRLTGAMAQEAEGLPPRQYAEAAAIYSSHRHLRNMQAEGFLGDSAVQFLERGEDLEEMPLLVLSGEVGDGAINPEQRHSVNASHAQLASQSAQGEHRIVPGAGHITIITHAEYARQVLDRILDFLDEIDRPG